MVSAVVIWFLSGATTSVKYAEGALLDVALALPSTYGLSQMREIVFGVDQSVGGMLAFGKGWAVMGAYAAVLLTAAYLLYRRRLSRLTPRRDEPDGRAYPTGTLTRHQRRKNPPTITHGIAAVTSADERILAARPSSTSGATIPIPKKPNHSRPASGPQAKRTTCDAWPPSSAQSTNVPSASASRMNEYHVRATEHPDEATEATTCRQLVERLHTGEHAGDPNRQGPRA